MKELIFEKLLRLYGKSGDIEIAKQNNTRYLGAIFYTIGDYQIRDLGNSTIELWSLKLIIRHGKQIISPKFYFMKMWSKDEFERSVIRDRVVFP